ncbi:MAG: pilus assembly protein PilM [Deltaproteobacteria bacterium]|nr:pilus assembly protein PilM [Deltaproteobacteria bacterium]
MPQRILGIDLGSWSAKAVLIESSFRGFKVEAAQEVPIPDGAADSKNERRISALKVLMGEGKLKADLVVAAISGEQATTRFVTLPFSDPKKIDQIIEGELADNLPFPIEEAVFAHTMIDKLPDGSSMNLAAAAPKPKVQAILETLKAGGVDPRFLGVDVLELYDLYTHLLKEDASKAEAPTVAAPDASTFIQPIPGGPPDARLIVDIGHERTLVNAASERGIAHVRVIRTGGRDITAAIQEAYGIDWMDAEGGKHEDGMVASARHPAPTDQAQRMSDVVAKALQPLVRELRRTIQSIRGEKRVRVARLDLVGGGSKIRNLANYLAEQLNVPVAQGLAVEQHVEPFCEAPRRPAYACALAYALRPVHEGPSAVVELRTGDLAFTGRLEHLRKRAPMMAASAGVLVALALVNVAAQYRVVSTRESAIDREFCNITKAIVGREICEPSVALSVVKEPTSEFGAFKLPERSAFRVAAELSALVPKELKVKVDEMDITSDKARVSGESDSFDAVDSLVTAYAADPCFTEIKKGKLQKKGDGSGVEFQLTMNLECSQ